MGGYNTEREKVAQIRRDYAKEKLEQSAVEDHPIDQFLNWFEQAVSAGLMDPNAMVLSTVSSQNIPSSRIVLLKGADEDGFRFYTNYGSQKATELGTNPHAALCFYWAPLERQVRIQGIVERLSSEESKYYFEQRPRTSQLGAWASRQSSPVTSRRELDEQFKKMEQQFEGKDIPLPDFWGGYLLKPQRIEFWQGGKNRMHDRIVYTRERGNWIISRLAP